jgi:hypothetical protein
MSKPSAVFSPEDHKRILRLVEDGLTILQIANHIGHSYKRTQNYFREHGIKSLASVNREKIKQQKAETPIPPPILIRDKQIELPHQQPPQEILDPTPPEFVMRLITLAQKKQYDCSWIIGDPKKDYRYCGNSTIGVVGPYCEYHKGLSRSKVQTPAPKPYAPVNQK